MGIEGIHLMPDMQGVATIHPATNDVEYEASGTEEATLHINAHHDLADYEFTLAIMAQNGHDMRLHNDKLAEVLVVDLEANDANYDVTISIERHMSDQVEKVTFAKTPHAAIVRYSIHYGDFTNGVSVDVDIDNNGIDFTETWMP